MIPKILHYANFNNGSSAIDKDKNERITKKCFESWKKYCGDWELKEWNEYNFNVDSCNFSKECWDNNYMQGVAQCVKWKALLEDGGIFMHSDCEIFKPIEEFLEDDRFFINIVGNNPKIYPWPSPLKYIEDSFCGSAPNNEIVNYISHMQNDIRFNNDSMWRNFSTVNLTSALVNYKTNIKGFNFNKTKLKDTIDAYTSEHIILYCDGIPLVQRAYNKTTCLPYVLHYSIQSIRSDSKLFDNFKKTNRLDMELLDLINLDLVL